MRRPKRSTALLQCSGTDFVAVQFGQNFAALRQIELGPPLGLPRSKV
jgi:hypothetical protein